MSATAVPPMFNPQTSIPPFHPCISRTSTSSDVSDLSTTSTYVEEYSYDKDSDSKSCSACGNAVTIPPVVQDIPAEAKTNTQRQGHNIALKPLLAEISAHLRSQLTETTPKLVGLLATEDEGCRMYASATGKACLANGLSFHTMEVEQNFELVKKAILDLNDDLSIDGLIVYFPIFGPALDGQLRSLISARIDVEGVHPANLALSALSPPAHLGSDDTSVHPCTPLAVVRILAHLGIHDTSNGQPSKLSGKIMTIVNRSATVGRPLAIMLANQGAKVFSLDIDGVHLFEQHGSSSDICIEPIDILPNQCFQLSDVIISAVPSPKYKVPTRHIKPGAICLNVATDENFEEDVRSRAGKYARRLGSVTTLMLQLNAVNLRKKNAKVRGF